MSDKKKDASDEYIWLTPESQIFLDRDYLLPGQTVDERVNEIADAAAKINLNTALDHQGLDENSEEAAQLERLTLERRDKLVKYMKQGFYSFATPVWANFGTDRGAGISCFGSYMGDTMESILGTSAEIGMMSKLGGGTSAYFGDLRERGASVRNNGESSGPMGFVPLIETMSNVVSQGKTRRGSSAVYLPVDHPDILEWLDIRSDGHPIQHLSFGVTVPEGWMQSMIDGDTGKRQVWAKVIKARLETGMPFIMFGDNVNNNAPDVYRDKGMKIVASNLCSEISLSQTEEESFVCCLSSMNLLNYDEWKGTDAVEILVWLLDAVLTDFIKRNKGSKFMQRAVRFAKNQRALGIGAFGWHSYLMKNMIPFESMQSKMLTGQIFGKIKQSSHSMSSQLAEEMGEPELLKGYGRRHVTLTAIAPTKSSSFIIGQASEGIEPVLSNYYVKDLAKIKHTFRNPYLEAMLEEKGFHTDEVWDSIKERNGSVQHLECLTQDEKDVFRTFGEISQREVIIQASIRQQHLDQSQSLNLRINPKESPKDINALLIEAWQLGVKTLYYQHSDNAAQEFARNLSHCSSCEG